MPDGPTPFVLDDVGELKRYASATMRNRDSISEVLRTILPAAGAILEIASGTGEHIVHFAAAFPHLLWQPSDYDETGLASISAWTAESARPNILPPLRIDACAPVWPLKHADAVLCINMIHIAPWAAAEGLFAGAARCLQTGAPLYLYGPFREVGIATAESNEAFDANLKARNPDWGLRDLEDVKAVAKRNGFASDQRIAMPANNISLVFRLQSI